jgi:hypothetical protein
MGDQACHAVLGQHRCARSRRETLRDRTRVSLLAQIESRAEAAARACEHDHSAAVVAVEGIERGVQVFDELPGQCVEALRSIQAQDRDLGSRVLDLDGVHGCSSAVVDNAAAGTNWENKQGYLNAV